eukprot:186792-Hanusia_phi.AAC.2
MGGKEVLRPKEMELHGWNGARTGRQEIVGIYRVYGKNIKEQNERRGWSWGEICSLPPADIRRSHGVNCQISSNLISRALRSRADHGRLSRRASVSLWEHFSKRKCNILNGTLIRPMISR